MKVRVASGFSPAGYIEYGKAFLDSFHKFWPAAVDLVVYIEEPVAMPRGECRSLWDCQGAREFYVRHRDNPEYCGTKQNALWKPRYHGRPYCFRYDAVKFFRQCMIPEAATEGLVDGDVLAWLDGDVVTFATPPADLIPRILGEADIAFLGRKGSHSEIGFWAVRINERTRRFIGMFAQMWRTDLVFNLTEWHSAFVFDYCRRKVALAEKNLTPDGTGHVWTISPLRHWCDHMKGDRKRLGHSPELKRNA